MSRKMGLLVLVFGLFVSVISSGCLSQSQTKGAGAGAVAGGILGAVIGHQSGHTGEGAALGAALGAATGTVVAPNHPTQAAAVPQQQVIVVCPNCKNKVDVSGLPANTRVRCPNCDQVFTT